MLTEEDGTLKPMQEDDIGLFERWLDSDRIRKWFCPQGEDQRRAWMEEVSNREGKYDFLNHFIVYCEGKKIGYCLYVDCFLLKDPVKEEYGPDTAYYDVCEKNHTYQIGYMIGEDDYLNRGIGKIIIRKLEELISGLGAREIAADPAEENILSVRALLSNGFVKKKDGDYRKTIVR